MNREFGNDRPGLIGDGFAARKFSMPIVLRKTLACRCVQITGDATSPIADNSLG